MRVPVLVLIVLLVPALAFSPGVEAQASPSTSFETNTLESPVADWFTHAVSGTVTSYVTTAQFQTGAKSWLVDPQTADGRGVLLFDTDLCAVDSVTLWVRWASIGTPSTTNGAIGLSATSGSVGTSPNTISLTQSGGSVSALIRNSAGSAPTSVVIGTVTAGTWYDFKFSQINCAATSVRITSQTIFNSVVLTHTGSITSMNRLVAGAQTSNVPGDIWIDDLSIVGTPAPEAPTVSSSASAAFTRLLAFDVVGNGNHLIAREHNFLTGQDEVAAVRAYNGFAMETEIGSDETNVCAITGGVDALAEHVVYTACIQTGNTVDEIRIRSPSMGPAIRPLGCGDECPSNIEYEDELFPGDKVLLPPDIVDVHTAVLWQFQSGGNVGTDNSFSSFAYSTTAGEIGIWAVTYNERDLDKSANAPRAFSTGAPHATCFTELSTGEKLIGAAHGDAATTFYEAKAGFTSKSGVTGTWWDPHATMTPWITNGQQYGQARGMACGGDKAVIGKSDGTIRVFSLLKGTAFGALQCSASVPGLETQGLAMSSTGNFFVAVDGTASYAFNTTGPNCGLVAEGGRPSGVFVGVKMDAPGGHAWIGTRTEIARYEFTPYTCANECIGGLDGSDTPGSGAGGGGGSGSGIQLGGARVTDRLFGGMSIQTRAITGLFLVFAGMFFAYKLAGSSPAVVGGAACLVVVGNVVITIWEAWVIIGIAGMSGVVAFTAWLARKVGG